MNFLLRTTSSNPVVLESPTIPEPKTLEGLIAEDPIARSPSREAVGGGDDDSGGGAGISRDGVFDVSSKFSLRSHTDITEKEGWIAIPYEGLPEDWSSASDIQFFGSLDRSFVFPGEQLHVLACLSAAKQNPEIITPTRAAEMTCILSPSHGNVDTNMNGEIVSGEMEGNRKKTNVEENFSATESLLLREDQKNQAEILLERFMNSHFFVRIAESDEPLWSKRSIAEDNAVSKKSSSEFFLNSIVDKGNFDGYASGGAARNTIRCCSLRNGDIVVLLKVNVGIDVLEDPVLEVLQFQKAPVSFLSSEHSQNASACDDPYGELLRWLIPLDNALFPPSLPPSLGSVSGAGGAHHRPTLSGSSGSPIFSFGNFRSYSMSSLPHTTISSPAAPSHTKPRSSLESLNQFPEKFIKNHDVEIEGHLSFRSVPIEPEQFSVQCGLEGIYLPGKRWRKKLEVIQPIEIQSFAAECNTEDLLCVQIKNVSPVHVPDIIIFLDTISIIFEEAPKSGPPLSLPISCIETGSCHTLPNLALRRGEEHSFILKPSTAIGSNFKVYHNESSYSSHQQVGPPRSNALMIPNIGSRMGVPVNENNYAILVSYRCNYTESQMFLKKATSWHPRVPRDLMISVASEMSEQIVGPEGRTSQLPVKVLTLQASNLTYEDLNLMVLAPASFTAPPSVVSLNSTPTTPVGPKHVFPELIERVTDKDEANLLSNGSMPASENKKEHVNIGMRSFSLNETTSQSVDVVPSSDLGCTHLWLHSTVPLGCVPAQSSVTVKLELLPLTDGIITLDTLQVAVKEKGVTYVPEHSLKIHATSSVATGIA